MIEAEIDITEAMESFSKAAKSHDLSSAVRENLDEIGRLLTMNVNLRNISNIELAKLFDLVAKADDRHLAKKIVYRLAYRHHESFEAQLRYLGKRAVKKENYPSFNMIAKLWKEKGK
ncbi:hypothetical protein NGA74_01965 [Lactobacillus helveticus]|uniref:hypothetical protein n=1 Tax=Lactobacillus helveticus TaxID=1587 RepID=UPI00207CA8B9|nr:hypothetical protein [Lactobacillus helveticus]MCO0806728.1 hypothetical protein [Lactobacillus helveticus]